MGERLVETVYLLGELGDVSELAVALLPIHVESLPPLSPF